MWRRLGMVSTGVGLILTGCATTQRTDDLVRPDTTEVSGKTHRRFEIGRSVEGTTLVMDVFGTGSERLLIFGGIHGNEPTSATVAHDLIDYLAANPEAYLGRRVGVIPEVNPDGLARGTRSNVRGVDLNRNFPAENWKRSAGSANRHGERPASEPETRALLRAIEYLQPERIVSIHSIGRGRHCNNFDGPARYWAELMAEQNGYVVAESMGYPTPGSFGSWAGVDRLIPTITLELPRELDAETTWQENRTALLAFICNGFAD